MEESRRIADLSDDDKPREKAIAHGIGSLSAAELIALTLGSGLPGKSVIDLSRDILESCGNDLNMLSRMSIREISRKFKGVGPAKAVKLVAALELGRRSARQGAVAMPSITSSADAYEMLRDDMQNLDHEQFRILILNRAGKVRSNEIISSGGTAATVVDVKLLLKRAVDCLADSIILAHNHPSGIKKPSTQDDSLTTRIKEGAAYLDIRVLDHIIVTTSGYYSYRDEGRL